MSLSDPSRRRTLLGLVAAGPALALAGCGFQLRTLPQLPFRTLALTGFAPRSQLAGDLRRLLEQRVAVVDRVADAQVVLQSLVDARERSIVAQTAAAQVRELQLRLKFHFRVTSAAGRELVPRAELLLTRDMSYDESRALAKEAEEAELFREMQTDVALQVMRRLATLKI